MARNVDDLNSAAEEIRRSSRAETLLTPVVHVEPTDVMDEKQLQRGITNAENALGKIDIIVPCAGTALTGKIMDRSTADFRKEMELNYMGTVPPFSTSSFNSSFLHMSPNINL
jgi:3-dehydrosphinganine reductase